MDPTTIGTTWYEKSGCKRYSLDASSMYLSVLTFSSLATLTSIGIQISMMRHFRFCRFQTTISGLFDSIGGWTPIFLSHHTSAFAVLVIASGVLLTSVLSFLLSNP